MREPSNFAMRELRKAVREIEVRNQLQFGIETWGDLKDAVVEVERFWETDLNKANIEISEMKAKLDEIFYMANASADGHDEINEDTPEAYIKLLEGRIDAIQDLAKAALKNFQ